MEACTAVEREIDKVLSKFSSFSDHASNTLTTLRNDIESLQTQIKEGNCVIEQRESWIYKEVWDRHNLIFLFHF